MTYFDIIYVKKVLKEHKVITQVLSYFLMTYQQINTVF